MFFRWSIAALTIIGLVHPSSSSSNCDCGYRVPYEGNSSTQASHLLFTDAVQVNFRTLRSMNCSKDWKIKSFHRDYVPDSGRYGKEVDAKNIIPNPLVNAKAGWDSPSIQGADVDAGLQFIVKSALTPDNLVSTAQIESVRDDVRYGSFRAYMKTTHVNGTCAASFWYHNDSQEIDIEMLSRQQNGTRYPVNLSVHSKASVANGFDARNTSGFLEGDLGVDPAEGFHEYRYDWSSDVVSYYMDGNWTGDVKSSIPKESGILQLSHWSDGNTNWTAGPPLEDAMLTVAYFMAYFNSTDTKRVKRFEATCGKGSRGKVCDVPDFTDMFDPAKGPSFVV